MIGSQCAYVPSETRSAIVLHFAGAEREIRHVTTADRFDVALALNPGRPGAGIRRPGEPVEKNIQVPQAA